ncbi:MAG TPA: ubiquinol-cytochrome C chaperone family protein [Allosphingosinicella sp.]|nr:ubiquinol-cytochrome C chaperone family protein [Allosphingosinicella sp.]
MIRRPALALLSRLFGERRDRAALRPLYDALVAAAREPAWYREGSVPDTLEGRFDMLATMVALALVRLESESDGAKAESVALTEIFIDDMDGTLRQIGIGDFVVGKHVGKLVGALGGRLGALREAMAGAAPIEPAVRRNVFRDGPASDAQVEWVAARLTGLHERLAGTAMEKLLAGGFPRP